MIKKCINCVFLISIGYSIGVTSGGELSKNQLGIDIKHYDIRLKVDTKREMLSGYVDIKNLTRHEDISSNITTPALGRQIIFGLDLEI